MTECEGSYSETIRARNSRSLLLTWPTTGGDFEMAAVWFSATFGRLPHVECRRTLSPKGVRRLRDACDKFLKEHG